MQGPIAIVGHGVGDDAVVDTQAARKEAKKELKRLKKEQKKAKKIQEASPCLPVRLHPSRFRSASSSRTIVVLGTVPREPVRFHSALSFTRSTCRSFSRLPLTRCSSCSSPCRRRRAPAPSCARSADLR